MLDREVVHANSLDWNWGKAWEIFEANLVNK